MPAPKMFLDNIEINQPQFGYTTEIYTGITWDFVGDNYLGYAGDTPYFKTSFDCQLPEDQIVLCDFANDSNVNLELASDHGFYPFSPAFQESVYSTRIVKDEHSGVLKSPWKYTDQNLSLIYTGAAGDFTVDDSLVEGNVCLWDYTMLLSGALPYRLQYVREIDQPPGLTIPQNYNTIITKGASLYSIKNRMDLKKHAGITSEIILSGSLQKCKKIIELLLYIGANDLVISCGAQWYTSAPSEQTLDPDYWIFGRKIPMQLLSKGWKYTYGWRVKVISNPITVTHEYLNFFSIKLMLALVV